MSAAKTQNPTFTDIEKQMLALAFMSDIESNRDIPHSDIPSREAAAKKSIKNLLSWVYNDATHKFLKGWKLVYGPAIYDSNIGLLNDNVARTSTSIYYNKKDKHLVIGVAGTNPISTYGWFTEDFEVTSTVPWNKGIVSNDVVTPDLPSSKDAYISQGTATALSNTWHTTSGKKNQTFINWLKANLDTYPTKTLSVTGHSLGGAISPALALALQENQDDWRKNTKSKIKIQSYIYAGPTPGNQGFCNCFNTDPNITSDKVFVTSIRNAHDVVPHAWELSMMAELYSLFSNPELPGMELPAQAEGKPGYGTIVYWIIQYLIAQSKSAKAGKTAISKKQGKGFYTRWSNEKVFTTTLPKGSFDSRAQFYYPAVVATYDLITSKNEALASLERSALKTFFKRVESITGVTGDQNIEPYLVYLFEFLSILANQHGIQYYDHVIDNEKVTEEIHKIFKTPNTTDKFKAEKGFAVLNTLIKDVYNFKNSLHN